MSIKISLYDFFAYTIPGAVYLTVAAYTAVLFGLMKLDLNALNSISIAAGLFLLGASYVVGMVMDPLANLWHRLFGSRDSKRLAMETIRRRHVSVQPTFEAGDFIFLLTHLQKDGGEQVSEVERFNVYSLLLRNISFAFIILVVVDLLHYVLIAPSPAALLLSGVVLILALAAGMQGVKFRRWYFEGIYQAVVGEAMKAEDFFVRVTPSVQAVGKDGQSSALMQEVRQ
jgi:hypothetical protein